MPKRTKLIDINRDMFLHRIHKQYGSSNVFAKNMRIPQPTMSYYTRKGKIPEDQLVRFANALNVPSSMLIDIQEDTNEEETNNESDVLVLENKQLKAENEMLMSKIKKQENELEEYRQFVALYKKIFLKEVAE